MSGDPSRSEPGIANEQGLAALGKEIERAHRRPRSLRRRLVWGLGSVAAIIVLLVAGVSGYFFYLNHQIHRIGVKGLSAAGTGAEQDTENILLVGSTDRCALAVQNPAFGLCSQGVTGVNSDVVLILHLNAALHTASILSIPRDLFIPNAHVTGANKIDAALAEGPNQLVAAIQDDFAIPIQHYVELNFDTFANVVDALGGIKMYFPEPVFDAESGLNVQQTGCLDLNGFQALQVVRARHLQYKGPGVTTNDPASWPQEGQSDLARIRRDHEFLRVLASAVAQKGLSNPVSDQQIVSAVTPQLEVDSGLSATDMVSLVLTFHHVNIDQAPQYTLPVAEVNDPNGHGGQLVYQGVMYGDVEFPVANLDQPVVDQFLGISPSTNSLTGRPLPAASTITVSVMNGTGAFNQATDTANALKAWGFQIGALGDTSSVGDVSETTVLYGSKSPSVVAAAQEVERSLSGAAILDYDPAAVAPGSEVTVVTGTDFSVNQPAPVAPPAPTTGATAVKAHGKATAHTAGVAAASNATTTTASPANAPAPATPISASSGLVGTPSSATQGLQPWDPRSCTATGGEGA